MENRGDVKSGCKGVLLRNSGRNSGVRALGTDSGRTGTVRTLELNSARSDGASDACVFFADVGRTAIALLRPKSEVLDTFREYKAKFETETGKKIKQLRCDGGWEYTGRVFQEYIQNEGINPQVTPPCTPEHHGIAEHAKGTIVEMVRCMLFDYLD